VVSEATQPRLSVRELEIAFELPNQDPVRVVRNVDLHVDAREIVGICGESGSGKTVTMLSLIRALPATARVHGDIRLSGRAIADLTGESLRHVRGGEIGLVYQDPSASLHPMLTVGRQLGDTLAAHLELTQRECRERSHDLLARVRIPNPKTAARLYPHQLSGGMRQRVAIALALAARPSLLIADEPTTALDVTVQAGILRLFEDLRSTEDLSVIVVSHDLGVISALAHRIYVMYAGLIVETGKASDIVRSPVHPYTQALLTSRPERARRGERLSGIAGSPPNPVALPSGCVFHTRCPHAIATCKVEEPLLIEVKPGHFARCPVLAGHTAA
jgi:oligopeptide transport system ATP-binding protein